MIHVEPSRQVQNRRACDKCHQSKLKCVHDNENVDGPCRRCQHGGWECVSSPPSRARRHAKAQPQVSSGTNDEPSQQTGAPSAASCTGTTSGPDAPETMSEEAWSMNLHDQHMQIPEVSFSVPFDMSLHTPDSDTMDPGLWTAKVADLNVRMSQHLQSVPDARPSSNNAGSALSSEDKIFDIDKTLHLSQEFVDILGHTLTMIPPALGPLAASEANEQPSHSVSLNAASELLMLSTHLHHIEMYDRVLHHMQACLAQTRKDSNACYLFTMPPLTIGSFSLSSRPETQLYLTLGLMESMLVRCRDLIGQITAPRDTRGYRGNFECFGGLTLVIVPDLALQAIRTREAAALRLLDEIKKGLKP